MPGTWALVALTLAVYLCGRVWSRRARVRYGLAELFELPWWCWPLARYVVRQWKREAHKDLWEACGYPEPPSTTWYITVSGWEWKDWRPRRRDRSPMVRVRVAWGFPQGDDDIPPGEKDPRRQVVNQARGTLDLGPVDYQWNFRLANRHVTLTPKLVVPEKALGMAPDVAAVVANNLTGDVIVPALGKGDRPITHSSKDDAPHGLISGTTNGGGKSTTLRTIGLQYYAPSILTGRNIPGADLLIVDTIRKFSHVDWAINPRTGQPWPGIVYADTLDDAARWITLAGQAMVDRGEKTKAAKLRGDDIEWSKLVLLLDDVNGLQAELKRNGHDEALHNLSLLLWVARGVNMLIWAAFQRGSARAAGGGDNRECYGARIWADGSDKTGDMIADQVDRKQRPKPKPHSVQPGHSVFVYGSLAFEAQRIMYTDDEARRVCRAEARRRQRQGLAAGTQWMLREGTSALSPEGGGVMPPDKPTLPRATHSHTRPPQAPESRFPPSRPAQLSVQAIPAISQIDDVDGEVNYVTLRDIAGREWCPYTYHTVRSWARESDDADFPDPIEGFSNPRRWSERAVREWLEDYQAQGGAKKFGVYFVHKPGDATLKIGRTGNLKARLRKWNYSPEWVRRWDPCVSLKDSMTLETAMHRKYARYHEELEWFRVEGELARDLGLPEVVRS